MYNSQYYTCEQIDERLLQGYVDDYNTQNNTNLTKAEFLTLLFNTVGRNSTVDNLVTQIGYYECNTAAGTADKVLSVASYALFVGGSMKVKFVNNNTANNATLNINNQGAKALYYQGERASATNSWGANEVVDIYYDGTSYYANNVNGGSGSGVYDVSKEHPTSGPNGDGKFTLEYILNSSNVNELIPVNKRYLGMSIQFVSIYNNKYVQYRLTKNTFSTIITDWQGVDERPSDGSENLVKSGGVYTYLPKNTVEVSNPQYTNNTILKVDGTEEEVSGYGVTGPIKVGAGETIILNMGQEIYLGYDVSVVSKVQQDGTFIECLIRRGTEANEVVKYENTTNDDIYVRLCTYKSYLGYIINKGLSEAASKNDIGILGENSLLGWILAESFTVRSATYTDGVVNSPVNVTWPDGVDGTLSLSRDANDLVTSVTAVHGDTYIMTITRDSNGNATSTSIVKQ